MSFTNPIEQWHADAYTQCHWNGTCSRPRPSQFGDQAYLEALKRYCHSLEQNDQITEIGKLVIARQITGYLKGRLYSEHYKSEFPRYKEQKIERPIFIIGLPRSGTTALHKILAADPKNQSLEYWLGQTPMPRPPRCNWNKLPEYRDCVQALQMMSELAPEMFSIHDMAADEADECRHLLLQSFANVTMLSGSAVPEYEEWLYQCDFNSVYQHYINNLKLIGLGDDRRWVLKDPSHLWSPQTLLKYFPDACIVQTHRHPNHLIPSVASLVHASCAMMAPERDKTSVGRRELKQWARVLNNMTAIRRAHSDLRVYDLTLDHLQVDPYGTIEQLYNHFDIEYEANSKKAVSQWIAKRPASARSAHYCNSAEFGLKDDEISAEFKEYIEYFGL